MVVSMLSLGIMFIAGALFGALAMNYSAEKKLEEKLDLHTKTILDMINKDLEELGIKVGFDYE